MVLVKNIKNINANNYQINQKYGNRNLLHSIYEVTLMLIPKSHKRPTKRQLQTNSGKQCKILKYQQTKFKNISKKLSTMIM